MSSAETTEPRETADVLSSLVSVAAEISCLLDGLVPELVTFAEATMLWSHFAEIERCAASGRILLTRRVSDSRQWKQAGFDSAAEWMASETGSSVGRARAELGTSERLAHQPDVEEAVRSGELSPEQAELISDAAAANPASTDELLGAAKRESHKNLKDRCGRKKAEADRDPEARRRRLHRTRRARSWTDSSGAWNLGAQGPVDGAAWFMKRWERLTDQKFRDARSAGRREPREAYAFDALMELAAHGGGTPPDVPGGVGSALDDRRADASEVGEAPRACPAPRVDPKHLALIRVDLAALVRGSVEAGELCEITGLGPVPVATARLLLGESILKLVISRGQDVVNVTHLGRGPNTAQKIALLWTHPCCSVEGCSRTRTQDDHRIPFAQRRETKLANLDPLCPFHHRLKTLEGWGLVDGVGPRPFVPPDDPRHPLHRVLPVARSQTSPAVARQRPPPRSAG